MNSAPSPAQFGHTCKPRVLLSESAQERLWACWVRANRETLGLQFSPEDGFSNCMPCLRDSYSTQTGSQMCTPCPAEHYTLREGATGLAACIRVQIGLDRVLKAGMKLFMSVWWLSFPLADRRDTVTVCKRQEKMVINGETVILTPGTAAGLPRTQTTQDRITTCAC